MEAWIYKTRNGGEWNIICSKPWDYDANPWHVYRLGLSYVGDVPKQVIFQLALSGGLDEVWNRTIVPNNIWMHIAGTYDGSELKLYVNGVLERSKPASGTIMSSNQPFVIGRNFFNLINN